MVEPVDPFEGLVLHDLEGLPQPEPVDDLDFEQPNDALGERIFVAVADAADRRIDASARHSV